MKSFPPDELDALTASAEASLARGTLVGEHIALLAERRDLLDALASAHGELDQIIYLASHDLRAPLRGIAHLSQWIEEDIKQAVAPAHLSESLDDKLKLLRSRVTRLERLIGGLLAYSRAGRGAYEDARSLDAARTGEGATLFEMCEAVARMPIDAADEALARVSLVAGAGSEVRLDALPALRLTLGHLIGNAARHGRIGAQPVHVAVTARPVGETDARMVEVTIADDGPGIEPRHHARIWELFQTLESRDRCETAGVGLAIVRRVVGRFGGSVGLDSQLGAGAAFRFTWPGMPRVATS